MLQRDDTNVLTADEANAIFDVLVQHAGVRDDADDRFEFVHHQTSRYHSEFRLIGAGLGMGGKFWRNVGSRPGRSWGETWYISAYREDEERFPDIRPRIEATNAALADLNARYR